MSATRTLFLRLPRLLLALGLVGLAGMTLRAADAAAPAAKAGSRPASEMKRFDIPAGEAFTTLKRFSTQSGEQLIYKADTLEGVRTSAVRGRFTALEALGRMLASTELAVTQDPKTGTLAITRVASPERRSDSGTTTPGLTSAAKKKSPSP